MEQDEVKMGGEGRGGVWEGEVETPGWKGIKG